MENEEALIAAASRIGEQAVLKIFVAYKADAIMTRGDMRDAKPVIDELAALAAKDKIPLPLQALPPLMSMLSYNTSRFACAESADERSKLLKETRPILKAIRRYGPKYAFRYPEALRLAGTFEWLTGRQWRAFALWNEGLRIGRHLNLKPELGRIGFEVAKRLSSPECRRKTHGRAARGILCEGVPAAVLRNRPRRRPEGVGGLGEGLRAVIVLGLSLPISCCWYFLFLDIFFIISLSFSNFLRRRLNSATEVPEPFAMRVRRALSRL